VEDTELKNWGIWRISLVAIFIGILTGCGAWVFRLLIGIVHNFAFLGVFSPIYDANQHTPGSTWGIFIIFVPVIGGIAVTWLIKNFAPEAKGHGVPEVMSAIHHQKGRIRGIVSMVKALASSITIGTGGSVGREGPIIQISSAMSSIIAQWLKLSVNQRNLMIACGASGGIAATFNTPIGGILFSVELLMLSVNSRTILPVVMSAVIASEVGRFLIGPEPAFHIPMAHSSLALDNIFVLALYFPFAVVIGLTALVFIKGIYWSEDWFDSLPLGPYQRHMLGMFMLGILIYCTYRYTGHYYVQGIGYATIEDIITKTLFNPWLILILIFAKLLAVTLTLGSGGSGGVFSPSMFLGATIGGFFGATLAALLPVLGIDPVTFALVGMAAMVAATTSAPMTAAIMTYEMTRDYDVILPIMVGVSIAYAVRTYFLRADIYTLKLNRRGQHVPHGYLIDFNSQIVIENIMDRELEFVEKGQLIKGTEHTLCVIEENKVVGVVNPVSYRIGVEFYPENAMIRNFLVVRPGSTLRDVLSEIYKHHYAVAVVSASGKLFKEDIVGVFNSTHLTQAFADVSKNYTT